MGAKDFRRFNHTLQECMEGLKRDVAEFGERYSLLSKALELLDTTPENQELVRKWFDLYMQVIDEDSYMRVRDELEELENRIVVAYENK